MNPDPQYERPLARIRMEGADPYLGVKIAENWPKNVYKAGNNLKKLNGIYKKNKVARY